MEFGIGFVLGGVSTGVAVANWSSILKAVQLWKSKVKSGIQRSVGSLAASIKSKLQRYRG